MLLAKVADTAYLDLAGIDSIFHSPPALQSIPLTAIRAMQQEQIDIPQSTLFHTPSNALPRCIIVGVTRKLGRVMYVLSLQLRMRFQPVQYCGADLLLVSIHLRRIHCAVACIERVLDGVCGFGAGHEVDSQVNMGHREAIVQLDAGGEGDCLVGHSALHKVVSA